MKKITGLNFLGSHNLPIPKRLSQKTYLLEYLPGTYGDFVSGIISYSIEEFYEHHGDVGLKWSKRYWNEEGSKLVRNRYAQSLRGAGYEHVERFTDFMLAHHTYLHFSDLFDSEKTKVLFNTHPKLRVISDINVFRTVYNAFEYTTCKFLYINPTFENIIQCAVNEYMSGWDHLTDEKNNNKKELFFLFFNKLESLDLAKQQIPDDKLLKLDNIRDIKPSDISMYGDVNENKFLEYKEDYCNRKLDMLEWNTTRILEKMRILEPETLEFFKHAYEHREIPKRN